MNYVEKILRTGAPGLEGGFTLATPDEIPEVSIFDVEADIDLVVEALASDQNALAKKIQADLKQALELSSPESILGAVQSVLDNHKDDLVRMLASAGAAAGLVGLAKLSQAIPQVVSSLDEPEPAQAIPPGQVTPAAQELVQGAVGELRGKRAILPTVVQGRIEAARRSANQVAQVQAQNAQQILQDTLAETVEEGGDVESFRSKVKQVLGERSFLADRHVENVFRTNVMEAYSSARLEMVDSDPQVGSLYPYAAIHATHDDRVRPEHKAMETRGLDGTNVYRMDDPVFRKYRGPWDFNCLLPECVVQGDFLLGFKSRYDGEVVEITTRSGKRTSVTANHPVLTQRGFVPARLIRQGDYAICHQVGGEGGNSSEGLQEFTAGAFGSDNPMTTPPQEDENNAPSIAQEAFRAMANVFGNSRVPVGCDDLHGEAARGDGYVEVVGPMRELLLDENASLDQGGSNLGFPPVNEPSPDVPGDSHLFEGFGGGNSSLGGGVGCGHLGLPLGVGHPRPLEPFRVGLISHLDASRFESALQHIPADAGGFADRKKGLASIVSGNQFVQVVDDNTQLRSNFAGGSEGDTATNQAFADELVTEAGFSGELLERFPGEVFSDEVVEIGRRWFSGHVYDFQSVTGWLSSDSIIVSNCRCVWRPLSVAQAARAGVLEAQRWQETGRAPAVPQHVPLPPFEVTSGFERQLATATTASVNLVDLLLSAETPRAIELAWEAVESRSDNQKWVGVGEDKGKKPKYLPRGVDPNKGKKRAARTGTQKKAGDSTPPPETPAATKATKGKVLYSGVVLDKGSRAKLLKQFAQYIPKGWKPLAHHMTTAFGKALPEGLAGLEGELRVTHIGWDKELGVVAVQVESDIPSENNIPHITLAVSPTGKPKDSNRITNWKPVSRPLVLQGKAQDVHAEDKPRPKLTGMAKELAAAAEGARELAEELRAQGDHARADHLEGLAKKYAADSERMAGK
jgi:hypothetical protein